ncbi:winged helix-turn-helix transcriptional regulator [Thermomonospora catenispora]|uniref:winged helix-turn-helix transcriptional regulator n=1 Tax=Thermomonospora catenispora TaxID=2493090 RepID=UPI0011209E8C|nr:helix-turn-helix domain-containing protein [Thermomonospora catenispora]TNY35395.1 transcriptional regulator [Thermomonospora catenispora]
MALGKDYRGQDCALARALEIVGERWTLLILRDAFYGVRRFSDFLAHLGLPRAVLSSRLQALVEAGVLAKHGCEYELTERGRELWPALHMLARWGERHFSADGPSRVFEHVACGTRLDPSGSCPSCGGIVPPEEVRMLPVPGRPVGDDPVSRALAEPRRLLDPLRP